MISPTVPQSNPEKSAMWPLYYSRSEFDRFIKRRMEIDGKYRKVLDCREVPRHETRGLECCKYLIN